MSRQATAPYRVDFNQYDGQYRVYQDGDDPRPVTNTMFKGKDAKADCERIVAAVNQHDRLQAENQAMREALEYTNRKLQGMLERGTYSDEYRLTFKLILEQTGAALSGGKGA